MIYYRINLAALTKSDAFGEASREELRVLVALISADGRIESRETLARLAGVSSARCASSLTLWESAGVLSTSEDGVLDEFGEKPSEGVSERPSREVAGDIRDRELASLIEEVAALMNRPALSTQEIKQITGLVTDYSLTSEYVLTLAAHLADRGILRPKRLVDEALRLVGRGIDNTESLEIYIQQRERESAAEYEIRRIFGIYHRALSPSERKYFRTWSEEYGYSEVIIGEAYDIAVVNIGKPALAYMHKLLTGWHEAGCKTVEECRAKCELDKAELAERKNKSTKSKPKEEKTPKYADFDSEDALMKALERSYGEDTDDKGEE